MAVFSNIALISPFSAFESTTESNFWSSVLWCIYCSFLLIGCFKGPRRNFCKKNLFQWLEVELPFDPSTFLTVELIASMLFFWYSQVEYSCILWTVPVNMLNGLLFPPSLVCGLLFRPWLNEVPEFANCRHATPTAITKKYNF